MNGVSSIGASRVHMRGLTMRAVFRRWSIMLSLLLLPGTAWAALESSAPGPVVSDPAVFDSLNPASNRLVSITSGGARMNGVLLIAQGAGPHPTVVFLHGFPGSGLHFDLVHAIRRTGWNALYFHYRGAWGSEGAFSFSNALDDAAAAIRFLREDSLARQCRVRPDRIALIGHSMGGFIALHTAATDTTIHEVASIEGWDIGDDLRGVTTAEAADSLARDWQGNLGPLRGTSAKELVQDARGHSKEWTLPGCAPALRGRRVLLVAATRGNYASSHLPLVRTFEREPSIRLTTSVLDSDHGFNDRRIALARAITSWLLEQP